MFRFPGRRSRHGVKYLFFALAVDFVVFEIMCVPLFAARLAQVFWSMQSRLTAFVVARRARSEEAQPGQAVQCGVLAPAVVSSRRCDVRRTAASNGSIPSSWRRRNMPTEMTTATVDEHADAATRLSAHPQPTNLARSGARRSTCRTK